MIPGTQLSLPLYPFSEVPPRTLETARLRLRAVSLSDLRLIFDLYASDPLATKYMAWPRSQTPDDSRGFWEMVDASFTGKPMGGVEFVWLIQLKETGEYLGSCGIGTLGGSSVGGGYILNPAFWGKGYAAEAWAPVIEWAKTQPHIDRIQAEHHPSNPASGAVMRKVGLSLVGINRKEGGYPNAGGETTVDELVYAWIRQA